MKSIDNGSVSLGDGSEYLFYASKVKSADIIDLPDDVFSQTVHFVQNYVEKSFELRITVVEDKVFACKLDSQLLDDDNGKVDWRQGYDYGLKHEKYSLPQNISDFCLEFLKEMHLNFGCYDFIVTPSGEYVFLECNPNGQWLWIEDYTRMKISEALAESLIKHHNNMEINRKELYDRWVDKVCAYLEEVGPELGDNGCTCGTFQSRPVLDKSPDVVFLGYNPHEDFGYNGVDKDRFYKGNPFFYSERETWKVWTKPYGAMKYVGYTKPMEDGNFVFFNAVYFGTDDIEQMKRLPGANEATDKCLEFTGEVIQVIFRPKCIVCFSISECFDNLNRKFVFSEIETSYPEFDGSRCHYKSKNPVRKGIWNGIPVYGIPHPSSRGISNDDWGAIATWLKAEMQGLGI